MAFDQTDANIATLKTLANGVVDACQSAQVAAKEAQAALDAGDSNISQQLQDIITILQPFVPAAAPTPAPAATDTPPTS
jgi:hypothetical protein